MNIILFMPVLISLLISLLVLPLWIKKARILKLVGRDMNKYEKKEIPEAGGLIVAAGFLAGVLIYIAVKTFYFKDVNRFIEMFAILSSILIITFIGFIDDIFGWKIGLNKRTRILFIFIAAIPLMVINAGYSKIAIPFLGEISFGLIYPLIIIPIGIVGASVGFNHLAGYNGLEAGQGIILLTALSIVAFLTGNSWISLISLCMVASLFGFLIFNKFPAQIFPGDTLTYSVGALIGIIAIIGNFEKIAIFFFIPYIIEAFLKIRGRLKKESFAKPNEDGSLELPYKKFYGLEHISLWLLKKVKKNGKVYENDVVHLIWVFQIIIIFIGFLIFGGGLS